MVSAQEQTPQRASGDTATVGRLFLLDLSDDRAVSLNSDGSDREVIVTECRYPDGIAVDVVAGHVYWTNMGNPKANDGSIERVDLDGSNVETLVDASQGDPRPGPDATKWCVGVAIDVDGGNVYSTQKGPDNAGKGSIFRAGIDVPTGQMASDRADIEVLYDGLPERSIWTSI
jgi:DNA-binding beta-propeller fold protein YncE